MQYTTHQHIMQNNNIPSKQLPFIKEFKKDLENKGYTLLEIDRWVNSTSTTVSWYYKIEVPCICLQEVEKVIKAISLFWDFNGIDDQLLNVNINYGKNHLTLSWAIYS